MKAIVYSTPGDSPPSLVDRELPDPGPGEVRVRIAVSGVNPTDWKARASVGRPLVADEVTPNQDGAGTVDAVGGRRRSARRGRPRLDLPRRAPAADRTAAEYAVIPAARAVPLADGRRSSSGQPRRPRHDGPPRPHRARVRPGAPHARRARGSDRPGAGRRRCRGHAAIQLAVWPAPPSSRPSSSAEKEAFARAAGAHHVLRYPDAGWPTASAN